MAASTAVHSNAFNFLSFVQSGVDSRTGLYTVSISLPEVKTNNLCGPVVPLTLAFNPLSTVDNGYGEGWGLAMSEYLTDKRIISVNSGETFAVTGDYGDDKKNPDPSRQKMKEQKIESFKFYELAESDEHRQFGEYKIVHKSGLVEILKRMGSSPEVAMPVKMFSPVGHSVTLAYGNGHDGRMLSTISDSTGVILEVIKGSGFVKINVRPINNVPLATFILHLEGNRLTRVELPTINGAGWRFLYGLEREQLCIKEVWTPVGGHELIQYNDSGHGFPGNQGQKNLPRVTDHITDPGGGQPPIAVKYSYSNDGSNFLGNNSSIEWKDDGLDNLYKVTEAYTYETTESLIVGGSAVRTVTRIFNRFHLQTIEATTQGNLRKAVRTTYYADDSLSFDQQIPQCQLAKEVSNVWSITDDPRTWRRDKELSEYDIHGNLTFKRASNGTAETITYFPAKGVPGECPADLYGFVRNVRSKTVTPASDLTLIPDLQAGAPTMRTRYRYATHPPVSTATTPSILMVEEQVLEVGDEAEALVQRCVYSYFNEPDDHLRHGERQRQSMTLVNGNKQKTLFTDYKYSIEKATYATFAGEAVLYTEETFTTDFDDVSKSVNLERSLLTGESLLVSDKDEQLRYTYDALGRVLSETEAPESGFPATRTFTYHLVCPACPGEEPVTELAYQELTDVKKVKTRTWFDGLARATKEELEDIDNADGGTPVFRVIYEANYDAWGQLQSETEVDWLGKTDLRLTSTFTYDDWGQQDSATGPNGVTNYTRKNPITFVTESWVEGIGKSVTLTNRFDKPVKTERFALDGKTRVSLHKYKYDGHGNTTEEIDPLGRVTRYSYDSKGRMISTILPDRTVVGHRYAEHSCAELPTAITVKPGNNALEPVTVGEQRFDGLERLTHVIVGPRLERLEYEGGRLQPHQRITAAGKTIKYKYKPGLTSKPTAVEAEDDNASFNYDLLNGNLEKSSNDQGTYDFTYNSAGHLSVETWTEPGTPKPWVTRYTSSLKGRQLTRTDVGEQTTHAEYDVNPATGVGTGRLTKVTQRQLESEFEYDPLGRLYRTTTSDLGTGNALVTTLSFDDLGREKNRTLTLRNSSGKKLQAERSIDLTYLADGNLQTRHLSVDGKTALLETFQYDLRGRMEIYECSGDDLPKDRFGNAIVKQYFEFDALDNIIYSQTDFNDGSQDTVEFGFAMDDPCQLVSAIHSHPAYQSLQTEFSYDADGNLTHDELGQQLQYDSQSRLLGVATAQGQPVSSYRYDGHNHLLAVKREGDVETLRFYEGNQLSDTMHQGQHTQLLHARGQALGQQVPGDDSKTLLLLTDAKNSIIAESQDTELRTAVYTPYGELSSDNRLESLLAFNGEVRDPASGWYLLGRGYRAYNPGLMRFHSPDSMSPFGAGGINAYMYCAGNPIAFSDPTGHAAAGRAINNVYLGVGLTVGAILVGVLLSIVTVNPGPLAAALKVSTASATGTLVLQVGAMFGAQTTAATVSTAVGTGAAFSTGSVWAANGAFFLFGTLLEASTTFMRDPLTSEVMSYAGYGISFIALPSLKTFKPPMPQVQLLKFAQYVEGAAISKTSSAAAAETGAPSGVTATRLANSSANASDAEAFAIDSATSPLSKASNEAMSFAYQSAGDVTTTTPTTFTKTIEAPAFIGGETHTSTSTTHTPRFDGQLRQTGRLQGFTGRSTIRFYGYIHDGWYRPPKPPAL